LISKPDGLSFRVTRKIRATDSSVRWGLASATSNVLYRIAGMIRQTRQLPRTIRQILRRPADAKTLFSYGMFDADWYIAHNPDVAKAGVTPLIHYINYCAAEGRDPHPLFDTDWYRSHNPDVARAGANPFVHYLKHGASEGRDPRKLRAVRGGIDSVYVSNSGCVLIRGWIDDASTVAPFTTLSGPVTLPFSSSSFPPELSRMLLLPTT
jgi:hypothetical protein